VQPKALFTGAVVLLAAATFAGGPATSVVERAASRWTAAPDADPALAERLETRARIELAMAPAPLVAAMAAPAPPAANESALTLAANLTFALLVSKTGLGPPQSFRSLRANEPPSGTSEFAARDSGAEVPAVDGALAQPTFAGRRLTILQLGDSHTAADLFTGRVRERLQEIYGLGGAGYIVPGVPHPGVRSALFKDEASDGWNYEALQKSSEQRRFYLSGFNAVAHRAGAAITLTARGPLGFDSLDVAFLKQPGGGHAQVLIDGALSGEIDLDGAPDQRAILSAPPPGAGAHAIHEIAVRSTSDAPVTVTGIHVERQGDGVSYLSLGFPGATIQVLQKLNMANLSDDMRRLAPDVIILAFGTNEGFNDALDLGAYAAEYQSVIGKLKASQPNARLVMIGPPDAARLPGNCAGPAHDCPAPALRADAASNAHCRFETPPKLAQVREAQRRLAEKNGALFWDWSSVMPGPCGAQTWAAATPALMAHDFVHMTVEGYRLSADKFADFLIPLIDERQSLKHVVSYN
jgi:lysophospholipase L1-like esterase